MSDHWIVSYITNLKRTGNRSRSAALAGVSTTTVRARHKEDADFAAMFDDAIDEHTDTCEEELTRRAFGYDEPVVYQGQLTPVFERDADGEIALFEFGKDKDDKPIMRPRQARNADGSLQWLTVKKFSDTLLLARVKARNKLYSTERTELTGANGAPVEIDATTRRARIAAIMAKAEQRKAFGDMA